MAALRLFITKLQTSCNGSLCAGIHSGSLIAVPILWVALDDQVFWRIPTGVKVHSYRRLVDPASVANTVAALQ